MVTLEIHLQGPLPPFKLSFVSDCLHADVKWQDLNMAVNDCGLTNEAVKIDETEKSSYGLSADKCVRQ
jgi:hypothetical protein